MSNTIDNRTLEMQFNNKQFESGIQTSIRSLGQLEKGLQLKGATNGLNELDRATKSFSFGPLEKSVEAIASKFSALGIMGVTAMQDIANSVWNTGKRMVKSVTTDPIMAGFSEYETQINSIQTILANTQKDGTTLTDVTAALDELNAYADKTIYNFTEMTRNIGTFTAAGIKLDTATNAIQGIANLAAISGSTSQQASTAMYQLSQAMASGTVKLMDWNSVVNAGMGGQVFQDALKETAKAHGVAIDDMIKKHGSFRETLSEGWITTEVLTETLEKFTASTEGLTEEQIKANREMWKARGYTEEQIDAIFEMGKTATDAATKVKTFTQLFDTLKEAAQSGWTQSWEILVGDFEEAKALLTAISDEIGGIINDSAAVRNNLLQGWKDLGGRDDLIEGVKNLYELLKALIKPAQEAFEEMFPAITIEQLKDFTQKFETFTKKLKVSPDMADRLKRSFKGFFAILDIGAQGISALASGFAKVIRYAIPVGGNLLDMAASLGDFLVELSSTIRETGFFNTAMDKIGVAVKFVADKFDKLTQKGAEMFKFLSTIDLSGIEIKIEPLKALAEAGSWVMDKLTQSYVKALPVILTVGSYITKAFSNVASSVSGMVQDGTLTEMTNGGVLVALIVGITKVANAIAKIGESASGFLDGLGDIFEGVTGALEGMQNKLNAEALKSIATAVAILAAALVAISLINQDNIAPALAAITAMFVELIGALGVMIKVAGGSKMAEMFGAVKVMKGLATAVLILAAAMAIMGNMDTAGIIAGGVAVVALITTLAVVTKKLGSGGTQLMSGAGSLIALAVAIGILAASVKLLGIMKPEDIIKGLLGLGGVLVELYAFLGSTNFASISISAGLGLMAIAIAMGIMAGAIRLLGSADMVTLLKGLDAMAISLLMVSIAVEGLPSNMISIGVGFMAIATSLLIMGAALRVIGGMSVEELAKGLVALAVGLTAMVVAVNLAKGGAAGAAAVLIMATALIGLAAALRIIGAMSVGELAKSLITLAVTLAVIGAAAFLLTPLTPAILALGAALLVFGVGAAATGAAMLVLGVGLTALVTAIVASVTTIISAIPVIAEQIGLAIVAIALAIEAAAPACATAISAVIQAIVDIIVNGIVSISTAVGGAGPAILQLAGILLTLGVAAAVLAPLVPAIVALSTGLVAFGISCAAIAAGVTLLAGALALLGASGLVVATSLSDIYNTIDAMGDLSLDAVKDAASLFRSAGEEAAEKLLEGFDGAAVSGMTESMQRLMAITVSVLSLGYSDFQDAGKTMIGNLSIGAESGKDEPSVVINTIVLAMVKECRSQYDGFYNAGAYMVKGLANGIRSNRYLAMDAGSSLGRIAKQATMDAVDAHSPARDFEDIGMWIDMGLANGLIKFAKLATNAATYLGESTIQPVMTMTDNMLGDLNSMGSALRGTASLASSLDSSITSEQYVTVDHTFGELTVKGVNDRGEFVAVADYAVEEMMTELMRKGIRR